MDAISSKFEIDYAKVGCKIQKMRNMQLLTQSYIANKVDISLSHMSNIETAKTKPSLLTLCRISRVLGCTLDELIFDDEITLKYMYLKFLEQIDEFEVHMVEDIIESIKKNKKYLG